MIAQTRSRVLEGRKVASEEQVLSRFEPHTRVIPRQKGGADVEFEHPLHVLTGDRGVRSPGTQRTGEEAGVHVVAPPTGGKISAGLKRWLGWGMVASNFKQLAQAKVTRSRQQQAA